MRKAKTGHQISCIYLVMKAHLAAQPGKTVGLVYRVDKRDTYIRFEIQEAINLIL